MLPDVAHVSSVQYGAAHVGRASHVLTLVGGHPALATSGKRPASQCCSWSAAEGAPAGGRVPPLAPLSLPSPRPAHSLDLPRKAASAAHCVWLGEEMGTLDGGPRGSLLRWLGWLLCGSGQLTWM